MTKPYSEALRLQVVRAVRAGVTFREAAEAFGVGFGSVARWMQRFDQTGVVSGKRMGGDRRSRLHDQRGWILDRIGESPQPNVAELRRELAGRGVAVGYATLWRFVRKEHVLQASGGRRQGANRRSDPT